MEIPVVTAVLPYPAAALAAEGLADLALPVAFPADLAVLPEDFPADLAVLPEDFPADRTVDPTVEVPVDLMVDHMAVVMADAIN